MRHLPIPDVESVLRRGKSVEQFLGKNDTIVRWVELRLSTNGVEVWVFEVEDVSSSDYVDLYSFPEVESSFEEPVVIVPLTQAVEWCANNLNTSSTRWVNQGVVQSEYADTFA